MENKWKELSLYKQGLIIIAVIFVLYNLTANMSFIMSTISRFFNVLAPFIIGSAMAYFLSRPVIKLNAYLGRSSIKFIQKKSHPLAVILMFFIVILAVTVVVSYVSPIIAGNLMDFIGNIPDYYTSAIEWVRGLGSDHWLYGFLPDIPDAAELIDVIAPTEGENMIDSPLVLFITNSLGTIVSNIVNVTTSLMNFAMGMIVALYLLLYKESVLALTDRIATVLIKPKTLDFLKTYLRKSNEVFYKFIAAQFLDACILGTLDTILLAALNVEYAITLVLLLGICNMIPFFGSIFASLITTAVTLFTGGVQQAIIVLGSLLVLQQLDANFISPKITGDALGLNPLLIVISIFIGGAYLRIVGMFIAVPVAAICKIFLEDYLTMREKELGIRKN